MGWPPGQSCKEGSFSMSLARRRAQPRGGGGEDTDSPPASSSGPDPEAGGQIGPGWTTHPESGLR